MLDAYIKSVVQVERINLLNASIDSSKPSRQNEIGTSSVRPFSILNEKKTKMNLKNDFYNRLGKLPEWDSNSHDGTKTFN